MEYLKSTRLSENVYNTLLNFALGYFLEKPVSIDEYGVRFFQESIAFASSKAAETETKSPAVEFDEFVGEATETTKRRGGICLRDASEIENENQTPHVGNSSTLRVKLFLLKIFPFKYLDAACVDEIVNKMFLIKVAAGNTIIRQEDEGRNLFVIESGEYEEWITSFEVASLMFEYNSWGCFGLSSLIFPHLSPSNILAKTDGALWVLNSDDYRTAVARFEKKMVDLKRRCVNSWPVVSTLSLADREKLIDAVELFRYKKGCSVVNGTAGSNGFYFVKSGRVSVRRNEWDREEDKVVIFGDHFGDFSMFCNRLNGTRAVALQSSEIFFLSDSAFRRLLGPLANKLLETKSPNFTKAEDSTLKQHLTTLTAYREKNPHINFLTLCLQHYEHFRDTIEGDSKLLSAQGDMKIPGNHAASPPFPPVTKSLSHSSSFLICMKTELSTDNRHITTDAETSLDNVTYTVSEVKPAEEQITKIKNILKNVAIFNPLEDPEMTAMIRNMQLVKVYPGHYVVKRGKLGKFFYVIEKGTFKFLIHGNGVTHEILNCPEYFGELGLILDVPRFTDVLATSEGKLWALSRDRFRKITNSYFVKKKGLNFKRVKTAEGLEFLRDYDIKALSMAMENLTFSDREIILAFEQDSCGLYFIKQGTVRVFSKRFKNNVKLLNKGQSFGLLLFSTEKSANFKAQAIGSSKILRLPIDAFEQLLGHCRRVLHQNDILLH